jgi:hypothetical protein
MLNKMGKREVVKMVLNGRTSKTGSLGPVQPRKGP